MKKFCTFTLFLFFLVPAKIHAMSLERDIRYVPANSDIFMYVDMKRVTSFITAGGIPAADIPLIAGDQGSREIMEFFSRFGIALTDIREMAVARSSAAMQGTDGVLLFMTASRSMSLPGGLAGEEKVKGGTIHQMNEDDSLWFSLADDLFVAGSRNDLAAYLARRAEKKAEKNPVLESFIKSSTGKTIYARMEISDAMRTMMRMALAMGAAQFSGLDSNVFIHSIFNLQDIEFSVETGSDVTFSAAWNGREKEDGERLMMVSHFMIVSTSLAVSVLSSQSGTGRETTGFEDLQAMFGRIRSSQTAKGVKFHVTLLSDEIKSMSAYFSRQIAKAREDARIRALRERVSGLVEAIRSGDSAAVRKLLDEKVPLDRNAIDGTNPLVAACERGDASMAEFLISRGSDVNGSSDDGITPCAAAAGSGNLQLLQYLLSMGAQLNPEDQWGESALNIAAASGRMEMVKFLLGKGMDVNLVSGGTTPLHRAAEGGHYDIVVLLVEKGASVVEEDFEGLKPSDRADASGFEKIAAFLREREKLVKDDSVPEEDDFSGTGDEFE